MRPEATPETVDATPKAREVTPEARPLLSIVIPSYRGVDRLPALLDDLESVLGERPGASDDSDADHEGDDRDDGHGGHDRDGGGGRDEGSDGGEARDGGSTGGRRIEVIIVDDGSPAEEQRALRDQIAQRNDAVLRERVAHRSHAAKGARPAHQNHPANRIPIDSGGRAIDSEGRASDSERRAVDSGPRAPDSMNLFYQTVCLPANRGQQYATIAGVSLTKGELVATIDDDGAHPPRHLRAMVDQMISDRSIDLLYGAPNVADDRGDRSTLRRIGTSMNNLLFRLFAGKPTDVPVTSFRVIRRRLVDCAVALPVRYAYLSAMLFACRPVVAAYRYVPERMDSGTRYSILRLMGIFWSLCLYWGPLRVVGYVLRPATPVDLPRGCD